MWNKKDGAELVFAAQTGFVEPSMKAIKLYDTIEVDTTGFSKHPLNLQP